VKTGFDVWRAVADHRIGIVTSRVPDAAEPAATGADLRLQHRRHPVARRKGGVAHDPGAHFGFSIAARIAHRGDAGDEFGLTDRFHLLRTGFAIHRVALQEHAADDVVASVAIGQELIEQIAELRHFPRFAARAATPALPQVMMRIDDWQLRLDDRLRRRLGEPGLAQGKDASKRRFGLRATHCRFSRSGGFLITAWEARWPGSGSSPEPMWK